MNFVEVNDQLTEYTNVFQPINTPENNPQRVFLERNMKNLGSERIQNKVKNKKSHSPANIVPKHASHEPNMRIWSVPITLYLNNTIWVFNKMRYWINECSPVWIYFSYWTVLIVAQIWFIIFSDFIVNFLKLLFRACQTHAQKHFKLWTIWRHDMKVLITRLWSICTHYNGKLWYCFVFEKLR